MKPIRSLMLLVVLCGAASCATMGLSSKINKTAVGMTKQQVVKELGNNYTLIHSMLTPDGDVMEIILFNGGINSYDYEYEFRNDILVRFTQILPVREKEKEHHHNHREK